MIVDSIDEETLLVVVGDHGMTETGDHGGDSRLVCRVRFFFQNKLSFLPMWDFLKYRLEIESALFFYSKKDIFQASSTDVKLN